MPRSHPPSVIKGAEGALRGECGVRRGDRLLVAVSGGVDSMSLLQVLATRRRALGFEIVAHGVDHGLRSEARAELDQAERLSKQLGVQFTRSVLKLEAGGNLQHRARQARYAALAKAAERHHANLIATAHHADDRAETVLLRLLRGSGPGGLAVLPGRAGNRIRPFIRIRRVDILAHAKRHLVPWSEDPSNLDRRFLRSQVRFELLPLLERLSPRIVPHLNALADALGSEDHAGLAPLRRAHLEALRKALINGRPGPAIRISDGLELRLERAARLNLRKMGVDS